MIVLIGCFFRVKLSPVQYHEAEQKRILHLKIGTYDILLNLLILQRA